MKHIILIVLLTSFTKTALASGWTSSGGGLFVTNENNPWFMGTEKVYWCIDHGGPEQFSLPIKESKEIIENGIYTIIDQLQFSNIGKTEIRDPIAYWDNKAILYRTCGLVRDYRNNHNYYSKECSSKNLDRILISTNFEYTKNCNNADLEIILGNKQNPKVKELIKKIGLDSFKKIAGIAIRTNYSESSLRGKGFIYIASDLGENQYEGTRNTIFKNQTIWNTHRKIFLPNKKLENFKTNFLSSNLKININKEIISPLLPIISHEIGHVIGFQHNHFKNLMDEDYPAEVIKTGVEFRGNFNRINSIINSGLNESKIPKRIGFEWNQADQVGRSINEIKELSPAIYDLVYSDAKVINGEIEKRDLVFVYTATELNTATQGKTSLLIAEVDLKGKKYKKLKEFSVDVNLTKGCDRPNTIDSINLKHSQTANNNLASIPLISLGTMTKCGVIKQDSNDSSKNVVFKLSHNYFQDNSVLELIDPADPLINIKLILNKSDILLQDFNASLPEPTLTFKKLN